MRQKSMFVLLFVFAACSSGGASPPVSAMVGQSGGAVSANDGSKVMIPNGALAKDTVITIDPAQNPAAPSASATQVGTAYLFGPEGATFSKPVSITLSYEPDKLPAGMSAADVVIYTAPANSTEYTALATTPVDDTHVTATTTHFSVFLPAVDTKPPPSCSASCKPLMTGSCECSSVCQGKQYSLLCYDLEGCVCKTNGTETKTLSTALRCTDSPGLKMAYSSSSGCSYPGKFP